MLLALNGGNIHEAAQILGHSSHRMTADPYWHLLPEVMEQRAAQVDAYYGQRGLGPDGDVARGAQVAAGTPPNIASGHARGERLPADEWSC